MGIRPQFQAPTSYIDKSHWKKCNETVQSASYMILLCMKSEHTILLGKSTVGNNQMFKNILNNRVRCLLYKSTLSYGEIELLKIRAYLCCQDKSIHIFFAELMPFFPLPTCILDSHWRYRPKKWNWCNFMFIIRKSHKMFVFIFFSLPIGQRKLPSSEKSSIIYS